MMSTRIKRGVQINGCVSFQPRAPPPALWELAFAMSCSILIQKLAATIGGLNAQPPSDTVRKQKKIFSRISPNQYCHNLKNITPLETLKFNNFGIFQSLKLRILMDKNHSNFSSVNFTSNTLGGWVKIVIMLKKKVPPCNHLDIGALRLPTLAWHLLSDS